MGREPADELLDQFEAGKISRRELVAGIGAAAVGGLLANAISGATAQAQAQATAQAVPPPPPATTSAADDRELAQVLLSRIANLRVTIAANDQLVADKSSPLVFNAMSHQAWLFDMLLAGNKPSAEDAVTVQVKQAGKIAQHNGVSNAPDDTQKSNIVRAGSRCKDLKLLNKGKGSSMPWLSKVFDMKMGICEVEGMFHMGKEAHEWVKAHCDQACASALYDRIVERLLPHYQHYFPNAVQADVIAKLNDTHYHGTGMAPANSHAW